MNKFKIGDKVETPFGVGVIYNSDEGVYSVEIKANNVIRYADFFERELKPYKTAHDKLLELGWFKDNENEDRIILRNNDSGVITIYNDNTISTNEYITLQLSKILTQYLEELEEHEKE